MRERSETAEPVRFEAAANVDYTVNTSRKGNTIARFNFAGGHLPDLVIEFEVKAKDPTGIIQVGYDAYGEVVEVDETNTMTFIGSAPSGTRTVLVVVAGFLSYSDPKSRTTMSPTRSATRHLGVSLRVSEGLKVNLSARR